MPRYYIKNYLKILNMIKMNSILYLFVRNIFSYLSPVLKLFFFTCVEIEVLHALYFWKLSPSLTLLLRRKKSHFSRTLRNILWFLVVYIKVFFFSSDLIHDTSLLVSLIVEVCLWVLAPWILNTYCFESLLDPLVGQFKMSPFIYLHYIFSF